MPDIAIREKSDGGMTKGESIPIVIGIDSWFLDPYCHPSVTLRLICNNIHLNPFLYIVIVFMFFVW